MSFPNYAKFKFKLHIQCMKKFTLSVTYNGYYTRNVYIYCTIFYTIHELSDVSWHYIQMSLVYTYNQSYCTVQCTSTNIILLWMIVEPLPELS